MNIFRKLKLKLFEPKPVPFLVDNYSARDIYRDDYHILSAAILKRFEFQSIMDIGCANGFLIEDFYDAGKEVFGVELSADAVEFLPERIRSRVTIGDFSVATGSYDLVTCIEVAEHVSPSVSERLVNHLTLLSRNSIYFTAAPPGQPGHGHINCRPHEDWIRMFEFKGWDLDNNLTKTIRDDIKEIKNAPWLIDNTLIFTRRLTSR